MGNRIRTRNSPDMLLRKILQFEFLSKSVLMWRQNARTISTHIRSITDESTIVVEIDFTWSLGFGFVEPAASVEARISLIMFEFSLCLFADSAMNFVSDSQSLSFVQGTIRFSVVALVESWALLLFIVLQAV
ncbi:hypothetical protein Tco_0339465 [Tanacetum coccineum]